LLSHSSGLPAWLPLYWLAGRNPDRLPGVLAQIDLVYAPGSRVIYSCVGFIVAGLMLQRVADAPLDRLFRDLVLLPLGLEDELGFNPDPARRQLAGGASTPATELRLVRDLGGDPASIPAVGPGRPDDGNARFLGGVAGNAGLFGSVRGVWELAAEYLAGGGRLLSPDEAACATTSLTCGLEQDRGLGWQLAATRGCSAGRALPPHAFGHTGFTGVSLWAVPDGRRFVLLGNRVHPGHRDVDLHPLRRRFHDLAVNQT
jgi:CubicO group peptidase (beta-lactamase class C family)